MMKPILLTALSVGLILTHAAFSQAQAQMQDPILSLPEGQVILNISATESREVAQDLLVGTLTVTARNRDARAVQNEINTTMTKALEAAKSASDVKVNTGAYHVYESHEPRTQERLWFGQQNMTVQSKNADVLLELVGKLQDLGLTMNGLSYTLAPATAIEIQDGLMEDALQQLQTRADRAAKALNKTSAELRDVQVNSSGVPYMPMHRGARMEMMAMASDAVAPPVAEAGETTLSLTVSARAILKP
ncbi:MAG: SIMPL domain-containing protein [Alphaproteobacteria bacterium]